MSFISCLKDLKGFLSNFGNAPEAYDPKCSGRALDILVIDVSISMSEEDYAPSRLEAAKKAAQHFISRAETLQPSSVLSVLAFSSSAKMVCPPLAVNLERERRLEEINELKTLSSTNTAAGLKLAGKVFSKCSGAISPRILLLTDGHANQGGSPESAADALKKSGVQIDIIGIGGSPKDVNEKQLRRMASTVNGELRYWFIDSVGGLVKKFEALALRKV